MPELYLPESKTFDYDDVILVPEKCIVKSRSEVTVTAKLGNKVFALPVIPANMSTIVDEKTCVWLAERNIFYVMHRFDIDAVAFTERLQTQNLYASVSLGIKQVDYETVEKFVTENITPEYITVDVAHGDSDEVIRIVKFIKKNLPDTYIIAGNIATIEAGERLVAAGASALKVGIGPGSACLTAPNTGFGTRGYQLSAVANVAEHFKNLPVQIIGDGGIRQYGDIAKSIAFGADMVMIGGMFAGHDENPGELIEVEGEFKKAFFGSASEHQKGEHKHVEGKKMYMPYKGSLDTTLQIIKENLQSSVSYAGGTELHDLTKVQYVILKK
jgi:GMP reductase